MLDRLLRRLRTRSAQETCDYRIRVGYCLQPAFIDGRCYYHDKLHAGLITTGK